AALTRFLTKVNPRLRALDGDNGAPLNTLLALLSDHDFDLPRADLDGPLARREDVPAAYLKDLTGRRQAGDPLVNEARRALGAGAVEHHRGAPRPRRRPAPGRLPAARPGAGGAGGAAVRPGAKAAAVRAAQLPRPGPQPGGVRQVRPGGGPLRGRPGRHLARPVRRGPERGRPRAAPPHPAPGR